MSLKLGSTTINKLYLGSTEIKKAYLGSTLIYDKTAQPFVSTWDTSKTSTGSSTATQIAIPTVSNGAYNSTVDWGDGTTSGPITTWNDAAWTHTYATGGLYTVTIAGQFEGLWFGNAGDRLKLLEVPQWGTGFRLRDGGKYFQGCSNLLSINPAMPLTGVTTLIGVFDGCTSFNSDLSAWNVSSMTSLVATFRNCTSFTSNLSAWNISNVTIMSSAFQGCALTTAHYTATLIGWASRSVQSSVNFNGGNSKYYSTAAAARATLTGSPNNWTITDGGPA